MMKMTDNDRPDEGRAEAPAETSDDGLRDGDSFHARIVPRLLRNIILLSVLFLGVAYWFYGVSGLLGFALGAAVSYVNFHFLKRGVEGLADRIVNRKSREKGVRIVLRFVVRYGFVGGMAYVIFRSSTLAFRGFLWGLLVPAACLMLEAVFAGYAAFRRAH